MPTITIQGIPIEFPNSGTSPNWAPAVIEFAEAVEAALSSVVGAFDISTQTFDFDASNPGSNLNIPNLSFPTDEVRSATINYAVHRLTDTVEVTEAGQITVVFNNSNAVSSKWEITQEFAADASVSFAITDVGQLQLTTTAITGLNHTGRITYNAKALPQS